MRFARFCLAVLAVFVIAGPIFAGATLTYVDLVKRLTDLEALSVLPLPGETCQQWSSYDRASKYDTATGKYIGWDANGDNNGIIRMEGDLEVLAEMDGPGCIWRIWSAAPQGGRVMIYLDGATEPAVDMPFADYFSGKNRPFTLKSLVNYCASGANNYVPIPYRKSCKIVAERGWGAYYHFTYSTFPKDTVVPTFSRSLSGTELQALADADATLSVCGFDPVLRGRSGQETISSRIHVPAGESVTVARLKGPRAINGFWVTLNPDWVENAFTGLRTLVLRIRWDGEAKPSVECPLGDFFGTAPGFNEYVSLPLGMVGDSMYSYWYMPFARSAEIEIANDGTTGVPLDVDIVHAPLEKDIATLGRFHAKWHRDAFLPEEPERRAIDWTMLKTTGRGRFVGVNLHVFNPKGGWWGEGDEKFYVDGEKFPSTFGTGSEDYFGYAWCNPSLFYNCYHNQPYNQGNNTGNVSVNRWHIADNIPFQTSFQGDIEKYYPNDRPTLYACTAYWYEAPGGGDPYTIAPVAERIGYFDFQNYKVAGAIEGEKLRVISCSAGSIAKQDLVSETIRWSDRAQLWWTGAQPGARLDLTLRVAETGTYEVKADLTKAVDYGIVQLYLDDKKLGEPVDLYNDGVIKTGELSLAKLELSQGRHKLTAEIVGANEKAKKEYMFGLDYVKLDPVK